MFRYLGVSLFHAKKTSNLPFLSAFVHYARHGFEIPQEVLEKRLPDMPVVMKNPYEKPKPMCVLCKYDVKVDYKNVRLLSQFVSAFTGRVYERHISGLCERQQNIIRRAVKKARCAGLMPYYHKDPAFCKDPSLFDPDCPIKPHKY